MIRYIINKIVHVLMDSIKFPEQVGSNSTEEALSCFKQGIKNGIYEVNADIVKKEQQEVPRDMQIFYREGYAFGLACIHALFFSSKNPDKRNHCAGFRIMHFTGYGFFKGIADLHYLPNISLLKKNWQNVADFNYLSPFLIGGESFAKTLYCKDWNYNFVESWRKTTTYPFYTEAAWHGCGRCLWFNFNQNYKKLIFALQVHSEATQDLCFGLGIAIAFTQILQPKKVISDIQEFPKHLQADLKKGAGISLASIIEEDSTFLLEIKKLYTNTLLEPYWQEAFKANYNIKKDKDKYQNTITYIRNIVIDEIS